MVEWNPGAQRSATCLLWVQNILSTLGAQGESKAGEIGVQRTGCLNIADVARLDMFVRSVDAAHPALLACHAWVHAISSPCMWHVKGPLVCPQTLLRRHAAFVSFGSSSCTATKAELLSAGPVVPDHLDRSGQRRMWLSKQAAETMAYKIMLTMPFGPSVDFTRSAMATAPTKAACKGSHIIVKMTINVHAMSGGILYPWPDQLLRLRQHPPGEHFHPSPLVCRGVKGLKAGSSASTARGL